MGSVNIKVATALLAVSTLAAFAAIAKLSWQINAPGGWRDELYGQVGANATTRAMSDFRRGQLRLFHLGGESDKDHFTGTMDGPFEVWTPSFYPSLGEAHRYAKEHYVEFYNRKMRYMHSRPERFRREEKVEAGEATSGK